MVDTTGSATSAMRKDWTRQPLSICLWWGLPVAIDASVGLLHPSFRLGAGVCAVAFAWMAIGCLLNAKRCRRVHCFISGPVLLLGAILAALVTMGVAGLSPRAFSNTVSATLVLALLSFVPELAWQRYALRAPKV